MRMRLAGTALIMSALTLGALVGVRLLLTETHVVYLTPRTPLPFSEHLVVPGEAEKPSGVALATPTAAVTVDVEPQPPLANPPEIVKAIYATSWSASSAKKMQYLTTLINETELNAIVIDVKDYTGFVVYNTELEDVERYGAEEIRIPRINALIRGLHDNEIYAIARISVFQDMQLALARPDLALTSTSTGKVWKDHKGLAWVDPASEEAWEYNVAIAREVLDRGFDEVNFDYIRFASDGDVDDIVYPFWDEKTYKTEVMEDFWEYVEAELPSERATSADLFGLATVSADGVGIGQHLEYALENFDHIAPMVYPSHYAAGSFGYQKPAEHPYEIVFNSMTAAVQRLLAYRAQFGTSTPPSLAKLRPWLQDFDLGADYTADMVRTQIQAVYDAATSTPEALSGWMLWNPSNVYTKEALLPDTISE